VTRGLLLDLLATEDADGVDDAHLLYARLLGLLEPPGAGQPPSGQT
jgi:hypothetical protein